VCGHTTHFRGVNTPTTHRNSAAAKEQGSGGTDEGQARVQPCTGGGAQVGGGFVALVAAYLLSGSMCSVAAVGGRQQCTLGVLIVVGDGWAIAVWLHHGFQPTFHPPQ
jgi:hypothetical protein